MSPSSDQLAFVASTPDAITFCDLLITGVPGIRTFYYWIIAIYPIGRVIGGPFAIFNAPNTLNTSNVIQIVWKPAPGATSYDVLRTDTPQFPGTAGLFAVATGLTDTTVNDQGNALTPWNPTGNPASPVRCIIHLNNRDYDKPTLEFPCGQMKVGTLVFSDGSTQASGGGQTPWTSSIDGGGPNSLYNVGFIGVGAPSYNFPQNMTGATLEFSTDPGYAPGSIPASALIAANQRTFPPGGNIPLNIIASNIVTQTAVGIGFTITDALNNQLQVNGTIVTRNASNSFTGMNYQAQELEIFFWIYNTPPLGGYIRAYDTGVDAHLPLSLDGSQLNLNTMSNGPVVIFLPTTAPAAGSHQLWADPADSYSVKWSA